MPKPNTPIANQVIPDPALEKRTRRTFTADYKLRIIREADACQHGELGPLLRREKLYANQLSQWRRELKADGIEGLNKTAPGPRSTLTADQKRIVQLEKENQQLRRQVAIKDDCLDLQKKSLVAVRSTEQRDLIMTIAIEQRPASLSTRQACLQLGLARSSVQIQVRKRQFCGPPAPPATSRKKIINPVR